MGGSESTLNPDPHTNIPPTVGSRIPSACDKTFRSDKALGIVIANTDEVVKGIDTYNTRFTRGEIKISKLMLSGLDKKALKLIGKFIPNEWNVEVRRFKVLSLLLKALIAKHGMSFDSDVAEEIDSDGSSTLFIYLVQNKNKTYELAICYVQYKTAISTAIMVGGLIREGLLGKSENGQLYLQM